MTTQLLIDGMLSGTGVRDSVNGGYVDPLALGLSVELAQSLAAWLAEYEQAHIYGFPDDRVRKLDEEGLALTARAGKELTDVTVGYFSNGLLNRLA